MNRPSEPVFHNREAFLQSVGIDIYDVPQGGLTEDYVEIFGAHPTRGEVLEQPNDITRTRIPWWSDSVRAAFKSARQRDYDLANGVSQSKSDTDTRRNPLH